MTMTGCRKDSSKEEEPTVVLMEEEEPSPNLQPVTVGASRDSWRGSGNPTDPLPPEAGEQEELVEHSVTTGKLLNGNRETRVVLAVIGNAPEVRPQTGLLLADLIYEFPLEIGSTETRFLALFSDTLPAVAGPIVSSRNVFSDLEREWDAVFMMNGYPEENDYPEFDDTHISFPANAHDGLSDYYFRDRTVTDNPDGNLFVRLRELAYAITAEKYTRYSSSRFLFEEGISYPFARSISVVGIPFFESDFQRIEFRYNEETNRFDRYEKNSKGKLVESRTRTPNAEGKQMMTEALSVQNLIVQYVPYSILQQGFRTADLTGSGKCDYFINGTMFSGVWQRTALDEPTRYLLNDHNPVILEPGNTWIIMHPISQDIQVTFKKVES